MKDLNTGFIPSDVGSRSGSDLALESYDGSEGTEYSEEKSYTAAGGEISVIRLKIMTGKASGRMGRPIGEYVTVKAPPFSELEDDELKEVAGIISFELGRMASGFGLGNGGILVAGLGNRELTADAVGPLTAVRIPATRHLASFSKELFDSVGYREISVLIPGVTGQTGIETLELMRAAVKEACPSIVVAVDALASRSCSRLGNTVQISNTGISPGSGVGNERSGLDRDTLGIPVISVGVPTIVNSRVLVEDVLERSGFATENYGLPEEIKEVLNTGKSFFVSPKDCDVLVKRSAVLLSDALTDAFLFL